MTIHANNSSAVNNTSFDTVISAGTIKWSYLPIVGMVVLIVAFLTNSSLLWLLLRHRNLQRPFTVYIINLLVANIANELYSQVLDVVQLLMPWSVLGRRLCEAYMYSTYAIHAAVFNAHCLIALNRIWAVISPITYRQHHSKRRAVIACVVSWVYINAVTLPGFVGDALHHKSGLDKGRLAMLRIP